ncbi:hypothetical protein M2138_001298 [Dysgonomonadaceae bacterium PH5-43]|nr:hypothetical protein [Dysgonomonadaceae bacterium PH5-43]
MKLIKQYLAGLIIVLLVGAYFVNIVAQNHLDSPGIDPKREDRKNMTLKEFNMDAKGKRKWLDREATWNADGYKIEDIEYAVYGQKERITYEYNDKNQCIRENVYNDKNKLSRIRKIEYHENGRKKMQYNYNPDGKLFSTKTFEYTQRPE